MITIIIVCHVMILSFFFHPHNKISCLFSGSSMTNQTLFQIFLYIFSIFIQIRLDYKLKFN